MSLPRQSQRATVSQRVALTDITIVYHRPLAGGRKIWGGLVPYGQVWRAGANENTTIELTDPVTVEGKPLAKGIYGLHMIPSRRLLDRHFLQERDLLGQLQLRPGGRCPARDGETAAGRNARGSDVRFRRCEAGFRDGHDALGKAGGAVHREGGPGRRRCPTSAINSAIRRNTSGWAGTTRPPGASTTRSTWKRRCNGAAAPSRWRSVSKT